MNEPHEHEFIEEDAEWTADEVLLCDIQCEHRPVYGSQYSERWDETFYDEGPRCEAHKRIKWDFDGVYYDHEANTPIKQQRSLDEVPYEDAPEIWEAVVQEAERKVNDERMWANKSIDPENGNPKISVVHDGDKYVVRYKNRRESQDL